MKPNSPAVVAVGSGKRDGIDFYPTPPHATWALLNWLQEIQYLGNQTVLEPACGEGHMAMELEEVFAHVWGHDILDYGKGYPVMDFLEHRNEYGEVDWVITNPPFCKAENFFDRAWYVAEKGVALLCRLSFLESKGRHKNIFSVRERKPTDVLVFSDRLKMVKGRLAGPGDDRGAMTFAWFVWRFGANDGITALHWIPPGG